LKQETTTLTKLIAGVCCLPKSGSQSGNAGLGNDPASGKIGTAIQFANAAEFHPLL